jgi:DNA invertase Pin-like site-specific DNA recombinase
MGSIQRPGPIKRCAIYTRKSSERGLDQDFNSLQAQHAICEAYIKSQQHKGWLQLPKTYTDPAQSGATLERPAMQDLLADIERGLIDVVVVYKLDRLSRSLLDFVRLLDLFDKYGVSFTCITQNFDTADSLGRLVMNVLLTFAQFERELTGDRIRDKKRAMSMKGLWQGGRPPLGYDLGRGKLIINQREAADVRQIYAWFLDVGSYKGVQRECRRAGVITKTWVTRHGRVMEGSPISMGSVRKILHNPVYAGYVCNNGDLYEGLHKPIVSRELWERVRCLRERCLVERKSSLPNELLDGLLFDCFGRKMKVDRQFRHGRWYVSYRSYQSEWGRSKGIKRLRMDAPETEALILAAIKNLVADTERMRSILLELGRYEIDAVGKKGIRASRRIEALSHQQLRSLLRGLIVRVEVSRERIKIVLRSLELERLLDWDGVGLFRSGAVGGRAFQTYLVDVPCAGAIRLERRLRLPIDPRRQNCPLPPNRSLVSLIAEARTAQALVDSHREATLAELAAMMKRDQGFFVKLLGLNYLAPDVITAILDGDHRPDLTRKELTNANLPLDWALQRQWLGLPEKPPIRTCDQRY